MAIVVETGAGVSTANSYMTQTEWEAYADQMAWDYSAYTDEQIESALIRAARAIDRWNAWQGVRTYGQAQGLYWPRKAGSIQYGQFYADDLLTTVVDHEGLPIAIDAVPADLVRAQAEATWLELQDPGVLQPNQEQKIKSLSAGSVSITYADGASAATSFQTIEGLLAGLLPANMRSSGSAMVSLLKD
jgi:hypothetical protein